MHYLDGRFAKSPNHPSPLFASRPSVSLLACLACFARSLGILGIRTRSGRESVYETPRTGDQELEKAAQCTEDRGAR